MHQMRWLSLLPAPSLQSHQALAGSRRHSAQGQKQRTQSALLSQKHSSLRLLRRSMHCRKGMELVLPLRKPKTGRCRMGTELALALVQKPTKGRCRMGPGLALALLQKQMSHQKLGQAQQFQRVLTSRRLQRPTELPSRRLASQRQH